MLGKDLKAGMVFYSLNCDAEPDEDIDEIDFMEAVQTSLVIENYNGDGKLYYVNASASVMKSKGDHYGSTNAWPVGDNNDYAMTKAAAIAERIESEEKYSRNALRVAAKLRSILSELKP